MPLIADLVSTFPHGVLSLVFFVERPTPCKPLRVVSKGKQQVEQVMARLGEIDVAHAEL